MRNWRPTDKNSYVFWGRVAGFLWAGLIIAGVVVAMIRYYTQH